MKNRKLLYCLILCGILVIPYFQVDGCHSGHEHGDDDEDYDGDYEIDDDCIGIELEDEGEIEELVLNVDEYREECLKKIREKRSLSENNEAKIRKKRGVKQDKNFRRLRRYFANCLASLESDIYDWETVVDFSILDTIWYDYTDNEACRAIDSRDNVECWKSLLEDYLVSDTRRLNSTKSCVEQYARDIKYNKGEFNGTATLKSASRVQRDVPTLHFWQMSEEQLKEEYSKCLYDVGQERILRQPVKRGSSYDSLVEFVNNDIKCGRCNYNQIILPSDRRRRSIEAYQSHSSSFFSYSYGVPSTTHAPRTRDRTPDILMLLSSRYRVQWPFKLQAMTKSDAAIQKIFEKCNRKFDKEFRKPLPKQQWAEWGKWTECHATCQYPGSQHRVRACNAGPDNCPGKHVETRECKAENCGTWSRWSPYSECSVTCGVGKEVSTRKCTGGFCHGPSEQQKLCGRKRCYTEWSAWSACTPSCGKRKQYSKRYCLDSSLLEKCSDKPSISRSKICSPKQCYTNWSSWSDCSVTCGTGVFVATRHCLNKDVSCPNRELKREITCIRRPCTGKWSRWTNWSTCSRSCGGLGFRTRKRACQGRHSCIGPSTMIKKCRYITCKPEWETWSSWSSCSLQRRTRKCLNGRAGEGNCHGDSNAYRQCTGCSAPATVPDSNQFTIPIDDSGVVWSSWEPWSECSVTCGGGLKSRKRTAKACKGTNGFTDKCGGMGTESRTCNEVACPGSTLPPTFCYDLQSEEERCKEAKANGCPSVEDKMVCRKSCGLCVD